MSPFYVSLMPPEEPPRWIQKWKTHLLSPVHSLYISNLFLIFHFNPDQTTLKQYQCGSHSGNVAKIVLCWRAWWTWLSLTWIFVGCSDFVYALLTKSDDLMAPDISLSPNQVWSGKMDFCNKLISPRYTPLRNFQDSMRDKSIIYQCCY